MFTSGDTIGPYTLVQKLGEGSFGIVWLAEHNNPASFSEVALKTLKHPDANAILKEVFNWAKADGHPNILPILEAGVYPTAYGDVPVIISSYMRGGSLRTWIEQHQPLRIESAIELSCSILDGLEHLHRRHIVHRDLKPENVLMYQDTPLLTDFGIARFQQSDADIQTFTVAGTVPYMAPEAFQGVRSPQTDVWAAAVICYELIAGRRPFPSDASQIIGSSPAPPLPSSVPRELRKVLDFALRKDPTLRCYKLAGELRVALLDVLAANLTHARPHVISTSDPTTVPIPSEETRVAERREVPPKEPSVIAQKVMDISVDKIKSDTMEITHLKKTRQSGDKPYSPSLTKLKAGEIETKKFTLTGEEEA